MTNMRPGQHVEVTVDTYGRTYNGHIDSIAGASGARYSLLPPENATRGTTSRWCSEFP